jgi:antitoxin component YwqK of YwqJK toxin-antitoxin module
MKNSSQYYLVIMVLFIPFYSLAQKYLFLLDSVQQKDLYNKIEVIPSYSSFYYNIDKNTQVCFTYEKKHLISESILKNNKTIGLEYEYYLNRNLKSINTWKNGNMEGLQYNYDTLGLIVSFGETKLLYPDSMITYRDTIVNNLTGELSVQTYFKKGISRKEGIWKYFNQYGECIKNEIWERGRLINKKEQ